MTTDAVSTARAELARAERAVSDAERARDVASDALDVALARVGWRRMVGALSPGTKLYSSLLYPDACLSLSELLALLEEQRAAAA